MQFELKINIPALLRIGLAYLRSYASFLIGVTVTFLVLAIIPNVYMMLFPSPAEGFSQSLLSVGLTLLQMLMTLGITKITLQLEANEPTHVGELFSQLDRLLDYFIAYLVYMFIVIVGLALLVFPGIYLAIRLQFYPFVIVDEGLNFWEALNKSFQITDGWTWSLFLWGLVFLLVNMLGVLFLFVGVIFTFPITQMGMAMLYRGMQREAEELPDDRDWQRLDELTHTEAG